MNSIDQLDKYNLRLIHNDIFNNINKCKELHSKSTSQSKKSKKGKKYICHICNGGYAMLNEINYHIKNGKSLPEALYILKIKKDIINDLNFYINKYPESIAINLINL